MQRLKLPNGREGELVCQCIQVFVISSDNASIKYMNRLV